MTDIRTRIAVALIPIAMLAAGCGGTEEAVDDPAVAAPTADASPTSSATAEAPATPATAAEVIDALAEAGLSVTLTVDYDEATDPNKQLGRPGGYLDKAAFVDPRIQGRDVLDDSEGSVELGGGVEIFGTEAGAQARADYIKSVTAGQPALTEYGYVQGGILLRLSKHLTPTQAKEYEAALTEVLG